MGAFQIPAQWMILVLATVSPGTLYAMSISEAGPPAEFPPRGFEGTEFVDSRGCYYIRTGGMDAPNWVPRVTRKGEVVCGLEPTFPAKSEETGTGS